MRRRDLIAGFVSGSVVAAGGWITVSGLPLEGDDRVDPVSVETIDASGSEAGTMTVPAAGSVTVIDLFATWCTPCKRGMDELGVAYDRVGDEARFVSVTNEAVGGSFTRQDIREWWREQDGRWSVALDPDGTLTRELETPGLPFVAVVDASRRLQWTHHGVAAASDVIERVRAAGDR